MSALCQPICGRSTPRGRCRCARTMRCRLCVATTKGREGKVVQLYCRKWFLHIKRISRKKVNGAMVNVGINPSKIVITKLRLDKDWKLLLDWKAKGRAVADKDEGTEFMAEDIVQNLD
ncbi:hypothetical protein SLA2020_524310 [Shorea laevis]